MTAALLIVAAFAFQIVPAQRSVKMKIPRVKAETPTEGAQLASRNDRQSAQSQPDTRDSLKPEASVGNSVASEDQPTIAKDSVQVTAFTFGVYRKNYDVWSWVSKIEYRVNGSIASGSQLYVEFTIPGSGPWVKFGRPPTLSAGARS